MLACSQSFRPSEPESASAELSRAYVDPSLLVPREQSSVSLVLYGYLSELKLLLICHLPVAC